MQGQSRRNFGMRLRETFARLRGRTVRNGKIGPAREGEGFKTFAAVMIAAVTIAGALVAWRSALAGTYAGNAEDDGLLAALNRQETEAIRTMLANQHRSVYLQYKRYLLTASLQTADGRLDSGTPEEIFAKLRPIQEGFDLATTSKRFLLGDTGANARFIRQRDLPESANGELSVDSLIAEADAEYYDVDLEVAQALAEDSRIRDIEPDPRFAQADALRDRSVALIATLVVLAIALWFLAFAEVSDHWVKWVWAIGGIVFLIIGSAAAWAIEGGASLAEIYRLSEMASILTGALIGLGALAAIVISLIRRGRHSAAAAAPAPTGDDEDSPAERRFKQGVTMMIASVALFAAVVGWLQADSGAKGDIGIRNAQRYATEALGSQTRGEAKVNTDYTGAALIWKELDLLRAIAVADGDEANAKVYEAVRDYVSRQSDMTSNDAYFDRVRGRPYVYNYQADTYLAEKTRLSEHSRLEGELNNAWEDKANSYVIHLTLLAAALALFGLSMTFTGLARPIFVLVGTGLTIVTVWAVASTFSTSVAYTPPQPVDAYARGKSAIYKGEYSTAIKAFDEALSAAPGYADALFERANAKLYNKEYDQAIEDYRAARAAGRNDTNLAWSLGWTLYLNGKFDEAVTESRLSYQLDPRSFGARCNTAIALLAQGKFEEARAEYKSVLDEVAKDIEATRAAGKEVAPSVWYYLDASARDLESLYDALDGNHYWWTEAPPAELVKDPQGIQNEAEVIFTEMKTLIAALQATGKRPGAAPTTEIGELRFGTETEISSGQYNESTSFDDKADQIYVIFNYSGLKEGQEVVLKIYIDSFDHPEYRQELTWAGPELGEEAISFTSDFVFSEVYNYDPGLYTAELYIDSHLMRRGSFIVEQPAAGGN